MTNNNLLSRCMINLFVLSISLFLIAVPAHAGQAEVVDVKISALGNNKYRIDTTLKHSDTGWDHYANAWLVFDESGKELGERILHHPHVNEQPFTRSLTVTIPASIKKIIIRAKDSIHGLNEKGMTVEVPK